MRLKLKAKALGCDLHEGDQVHYGLWGRHTKSVAPTMSVHPQCKHFRLSPANLVGCTVGFLNSGQESLLARTIVVAYDPDIPLLNS
jgi:hypothetical protein